MTIDLLRQSLQAPDEELEYDGGWGDKYPANGFWRQVENQQQLKEALATVEAINHVDFCVIEQCLLSPQCQEWFIAWVFILRKHLTTDQCFQLLSHPNAPGSLVELTMIFESELIDSGAAAARKFVESAHTHHQDIDDEINKITRRSKEARPSQVIGFKNIEHVLFYSNGLRGLRKLFRDSSTPIKTYPPESLLNDMLTSLEEKCIADDLKIFLQLATELQPQHLEQMADSKHWHLRLAVAQSSSASGELLKKLAKDGSKKVREAASISAQLSARQSQPQKTNNQQATAPDFNLRLMQKAVPVEQLREIAQAGSALSACAATLHSNSTIDVIHAAESRDLPEWAQLGIARSTDSKERIESLLKGASKFIRIALAANPVLTKQQALQLLGDDWCNAIIANRFIDDPEVLDSITEPEKWPEMLATLRNPDTKAKQLQTLFYEKDFRFEIMGRLIARHPNCPKIFYKRLAAYCPEDLKQNPAYALSMLESGIAVVPQPLRPNSICPDQDSDDSYEMAITDALNRYANDDALIRRIAGSRALNPNEANRLAITDDIHIHNRILRKDTPVCSEFIYRLIATTGTPLQRKQLASLKLKRVYTQLLRELTSDKDSSVRQAAGKQATKRGLASAQTPDKTSLRTLGNKAARIDLAKTSSDPDILHMLCGDKVLDVRRALAKHQQALPFSCLEKLLTDSDDQVVDSAFWILDRMMSSPTPPSRNQLQAAIIQILENKDFSPGLKSMVLKYCDNAPLLEAMLEQKEIRRFARPKSGSHVLLYKTFLDIQSADESFWLLQHENVPAEIIEQLATQAQDPTSMLKKHIGESHGTSVSSLIYLIKHHPNLLAHCSLQKAIDHANRNSHMDFADALKSEPFLQPFKDFQAQLQNPKDQQLLQQLIDEAEQPETV
ncbi:hypothetical protein [Oceanobacter mangrovi]|uniref:hypothetical protein n=1 Tax=Oceanobacter mangrovi TaxID=2862510 RepID=UPI001C8E6B64|nr:hypothetical protein [Oceanobacter mangrovi]